MTALLGWSVGASSNAFAKLTFYEAAGKVDASGLANIEGSSAQQVSAEIQKNLDYNLSPDELAKVKHRLSELRLQMPAYHVDALPADQSSRRKLFDFARSLGVQTIVTGSGAAPMADLDQFANEFGVNVALEGISPKDVDRMLQGRGNRIGVVADLGKWTEAGIKPLDGLPLVKDRLMVVRVRDRSATGTRGRDVTLGKGVEGVSQFLLEVSRLDPPAVPAWPPTCANCNGPRVPPGKPLFISLDTTGAADAVADLKLSADAFDEVIRPAMGFRIDEIARNTPISSPSWVHPEDRTKMEAALPRKAIVKPLKPRKLLVLDVTPNAYYHATCANANLAVELMAKYTDAFQPVFSNDLDNLKYPKIKEFDAVFLNGFGGGEVFVDPDVLNGLLRFVREGGGVAGLHGSTYASQDLPEYGEMMGGQAGNHRCCETSVVKIDDPDSPLTKSFGGKSFSWTDEFYHFPDSSPFSREKEHVLLSVDSSKTDLSEWKGIRADNEFPSSWIRSYGKGRVFNLALGHTPTMFETPAFGEYMLAALQFVLGDLKADTTPSANLAANKK